MVFGSIKRFFRRFAFTVFKLLRDCWQITFVTLNGFRPLSKNSPFSLFLTDTISKWIECHPKSNEKYTAFLYCISSRVLKVRLTKICKTEPSADLLFLVVFHLPLELHSSFYIFKKDLRQELSFFNGFTQPPTPQPHPFNDQSMTIVFCWCSLTFFS